MTDASPAVISVENISKWYGSVVAVNDVSFEIQPGVTGLLGPNGAGKTTLLKMIEGLASPSDGSVSISGQSPRGNPDLYRRVGVMSEHEAVYGFYTGREFVEFSAKLHGVTSVGRGRRPRHRARRYDRGAGKKARRLLSRNETAHETRRRYGAPTRSAHPR